MTMLMLVIILFVLLGIADLVVGVSNDAVNFLNSAIGSKVAKRKTILWISAIGLLLGSLFASGMMDLARTSVIYPQQFGYANLIAVFAAVMFSHILLVDALNTYGIPTSTTTALIFQLIGGALAVSFIASWDSGNFHVGEYIDTNKVFLIMAGIFISIFAAFLIGTLVQFLARLIFTFNYRERLGWLFSLAGALAVTVIFYLIIKKALYTDMFDLGQWYHYINDHLPEVLITVFVSVFFVFLIAVSLFNIDVPRWVVFFGTFALAMSFSSNDLVNFIGVPIAAIETSLNHFNDTVGNVTISPTLYLSLFFLSAVVMTITLFFSKKAQSVIGTEISLERQEPGYERFEPTHLSKTVVRHFLAIHQRLLAQVPRSVKQVIETRFQKVNTKTAIKHGETPSFDMIRASVNLTMASAMILVGTWFRIPLSTTFIVFMISMGTSLADRAWGRESAVYRLSGVFTILGTWFFTSCAAVILAFIFTLFIHFLGVIAIIILLIITTLVLLRTHRFFKKRNAHVKLHQHVEKEPLDGNDWLIEQGSEHFKRHLLEASKIYFLAIQGFIDEDRNTLHQANTKATALIDHTKATREELYVNIRFINDQSLEAGHFFVQALDYIAELGNSLLALSQHTLHHINNNHKGTSEAQRAELEHLIDDTTGYFNYLVHIEKEQRFVSIDELARKQQIILTYLDELRKNQIKRIRSGESKTRLSIVYMDVLSETQNVLLYSLNILKSHRDFVNAVSNTQTLT